MKNQKPYWQKLQDPLWQKKRLEIMERDGFSCVKCSNSNETLNVHHQYYSSKREPWEYPNFCYETVCQTCHKEIQKELQHFEVIMEILNCLGKDELLEISYQCQEMIDTNLISSRDIAMEILIYCTKLNKTLKGIL